MRISDWSSDVCSSDLCLRSKGACTPPARSSAPAADARDASDTDARRFQAAHSRRASQHLMDLLEIGPALGLLARTAQQIRSEEHTSELQSLMRISYAVFCLKKKTNHHILSDLKHYHKNPSTLQT